MTPKIEHWSTVQVKVEPVLYHGKRNDHDTQQGPEGAMLGADHGEHG